jgi:hypothetical protein
VVLPGDTRRARKRHREEQAEENALTVRQRIGVALSRLTQEELDALVHRAVQRGDVRALAQLADQAFGKPPPAEEENPTDTSLADLTREQRTALWAWLDELDELPGTDEDRGET